MVQTGAKPVGSVALSWHTEQNLGSLSTLILSFSLIHEEFETADNAIVNRGSNSGAGGTAS